MNCGIYKINIKEHLYIGSSKNLTNRKTSHLWSLRNQKYMNRFLQNCFNKHGENNFVFEVIEYCEENKLIEREQYYIDTLKPDVNLRKYADRNIGIKRSSEYKANLSKALKGKHKSIDHRKKLSDAGKIKVFTSEHKNNLSIGIKNSNKHKATLENTWNGKRHKYLVVNTITNKETVFNSLTELTNELHLSRKFVKKAIKKENKYKLWLKIQRIK